MPYAQNICGTAATKAYLPKVLFILFEGLAETVIDSQVLLHARAMSEAGIAQFEIWTFAWNKSMYEQSHARRKAAEQRSLAPVRVLKGVRPGIPGSRKVNGILINKAIKRFKPDVDIIHARTNYTAACCSEAGLAVPFIWDCRGDALAEQKMVWQDRTSLIRELRLNSVRNTLRSAASGCAGAIFVSRTLAELVRSELLVNQVEVIPCGASSQHFFFDPELRVRLRHDLGLNDGHEVYIYSGGLAAYQCFEETLDLFMARYRNNPQARLIVLTPATNQARALIVSQGVPDGAVILRKAAIEEVNGYLNAADCAFMIRKDDPLNHSASPTKFAEYAMAGLPVVMTEAVRDAAAMAMQYGNMVAPRNDGKWMVPNVDRRALSKAYTDILAKEKHSESYRRLYHGVAYSRNSRCENLAEQI